MENELVRNSSDQIVKNINIQSSLVPSQKILLFRFQCRGPACADSFIVLERNKVFSVQTRIKLMHSYCLLQFCLLAVPTNTAACSEVSVQPLNHVKKMSMLKKIEQTSTTV